MGRQRDGSCGNHALEEHTFTRQPVDARRSGATIAIGTEMIGASGVERDQHHVGRDSSGQQPAAQPEADDPRHCYDRSDRDPERPEGTLPRRLDPADAVSYWSTSAEPASLVHPSLSQHQRLRWLRHATPAMLDSQGTAKDVSKMSGGARNRE
jgi:hypothetical protein